MPLQVGATFPRDDGTQATPASSADETDGQQSVDAAVRISTLHVLPHHTCTSSTWLIILIVIIIAVNLVLLFLFYQSCFRQVEYCRCCI